MAYAASAPMNFYAQAVEDQYAYYRVVTDSAERAHPGCPAAVRDLLAATFESPSATFASVVAGLDLCDVPAYITAGGLGVLQQELAMVFAYSWANLNMANYPPTQATGLAQACAAVVADGPGAPWPTLAAFFNSYAGLHRRGGPRGQLLTGASNSPAAAAGCYNLSSQLPSGPNATISSGDWTGVGTGDDGSSWDEETCTLLVEVIGTNNATDMFPARAFTMDWLNAHCAARFNVTPRPTELVDLWGFSEARLPSVATRIIFTNGLNDGWSVAGITANLSDSLLAFNMPNGAHHSDLSHAWPSAADTPDVTLVRQLAAGILAGWLEAVPR